MANQLFSQVQRMSRELIHWLGTIHGFCCAWIAPWQRHKLSCYGPFFLIGIMSNTGSPSGHSFSPSSDSVTAPSPVHAAFQIFRVCYRRCLVMSISARWAQPIQCFNDSKQILFSVLMQNFMSAMLFLGTHKCFASFQSMCFKSITSLWATKDFKTVSAGLLFLAHSRKYLMGEQWLLAND